MTGKPIALITGAAQGIGLACAEALAEDGMFVILTDIKDSVIKAAQKLGGVGYVCDMGDVAAIEAEIERRLAAIADKDWGTADQIRDDLAAQGIQLKDSKDSATGERVTQWEVKA